MTDWDPKQAMGPVAYLKFKARRWVPVSSIPAWVQEAEQGYYHGFIDKYGHRPYDQEKTFAGNSLLYRVKYRAPAQGECIPEFYVRIK